MDRGIRVWDKVLLCASEASLNSAWVEDELDKAVSEEIRIRKERNEKVLKIIPLNPDGYMFKTDYNDGIKSILTSRLALDFIGWQNDDAKFNDSFEKMKEALSLVRSSEPESKL